MPETHASHRRRKHDRAPWLKPQASANRRAIRQRDFLAATVAAQECAMVVDDVSRSRFGAREYEYTEKPTALARAAYDDRGHLNPDENLRYLRECAKAREAGRVTA